jgi:hypothetical protein
MAQLSTHGCKGLSRDPLNQALFEEPTASLPQTHNPVKRKVWWDYNGYKNARRSRVTIAICAIDKTIPILVFRTFTDLWRPISELNWRILKGTLGAIAASKKKQRYQCPEP